MATFVFVYGTLKRGLYNYEAYLHPALSLGKAAFVGVARTMHADFHMVLDGDEFYPCLYRAPSEGYQVSGEVFRVDVDTLKALDILEEVDGDLYRREEVEVILVGGDREGEIVKCQIYLVPISEDLLALERIPDYTPEMNARYDALMGTPELEILECVYGNKVIGAVKARLKEGGEFAEVWKQVVGE
ncbi:hypothetical protein BBJ28_00007085 [Nothophytophthora sp. Chile5]|nr:hypothetical protein BBJ28_00007085 [Nothophytophthora sp. Chile5]